MHRLKCLGDFFGFCCWKRRWHSGSPRSVEWPNGEVPAPSAKLESMLWRGGDDRNLQLLLSLPVADSTSHTRTARTLMPAAEGNSTHTAVALECQTGRTQNSASSSLNVKDVPRLGHRLNKRLTLRYTTGPQKASGQKAHFKVHDWPSESIWTKGSL